mmetsp:Transcript_21740/g.47246  ORF Transcript_21740/g.47246 Transcript_21740/m.47246 type:complete len:168 (+) Transcript_21740:659-1162(+)
MNVTSRDEDGFIAITNTIPILSILNGSVCNFEIGLEEVRLQSPILGFKTLTDCLLAVAISANVCPCVCCAKGSLAENFIAMEPDTVGREVGSRRRGGRHFYLFCCPVDVDVERQSMKRKQGEYLQMHEMRILKYSNTSNYASRVTSNHDNSSLGDAGMPHRFPLRKT